MGANRTLSSAALTDRLNQGQPGYPRTPYYRAGDQELDETGRLYEFVVPMVPPT